MHTSQEFTRNNETSASLPVTYTVTSGNDLIDVSEVEGKLKVTALAPRFVVINAILWGFLNILEGCRQNGIEHLVYASSSNVYGMNGCVPFKETDRTDSPVSLYAATKKSDEEMAYAYSRLYGIQTIGLRFFPSMVRGADRTWRQ